MLILAFNTSLKWKKRLLTLVIALTWRTVLALNKTILLVCQLMCLLMLPYTTLLCCVTKLQVHEQRSFLFHCWCVQHVEGKNPIIAKHFSFQTSPTKPSITKYISLHFLCSWPLIFALMTTEKKQQKTITLTFPRSHPPGFGCFVF